MIASYFSPEPKENDFLTNNIIYCLMLSNVFSNSCRGSSEVTAGKESLANTFTILARQTPGRL